MKDEDTRARDQKIGRPQSNQSRKRRPAAPSFNMRHTNVKNPLGYAPGQVDGDTVES